MKNFTLKVFYLLTVLSFFSSVTLGQKENSGSKAICTWDGSTDNDWQTAANWDTGVPGAFDDAVIPSSLTNYPIIDDGITLANCNNLTIQTGASITIAQNGRFTVNGTITNNAGNSGIVVESNSSGDGSLIINSSTSATVQRYAVADTWEYLASPISSAASTLFSSGFLDYYNEAADDYWLSTVYQYATTSGWQAFSGTLGVSNGYLFQNTSNTTISYTGTLNYSGSTENIPVNYTEHSGNAPNGVLYTELDGWNILGNKYTCALDWNGLTKTNVDNSVYYWTGTNYASWNGSVGINGGTRYIPAQQGFFVKTSNTSGGTLSIPLSAKLHDDQAFWKSFEDVTPENFIRIQAVVNSITDETVINYIEGATTGYDGAYDTYKMFAPGIEVPQIFSIAEGVSTGLSVNSLPIVDYTVSVPVGIRAADLATVDFNITELNFPNADYIYLFDSYQDIYIDLLTVITYQFTHTTGIVDDRFTLYIGVNEVPEIANQIADPTNINEDEYFELDASNTFIDNDILDSLTYTAAIVIGKETPTWISFDNETLIFSGTPTNDETGVYNIILKATDTFNESIYCSFDIEVINVNDAPMVVNSVGIVEIYEDEIFELDVNGIIEDVDINDVLTYSATLSDGNPLPAWLLFDSETLFFDGSPINQHVGLYEIRLLAKDLLLDSAEITFIIKVINTNDEPTVNGTINDQYVDMNQIWNYNLNPDLFVDVDINDELTISALIDNSPLPEWILFNDITNSFSATPLIENVGTSNIQLIATDLEGANVSLFFNLIVNLVDGIDLTNSEEIDIFPNPSSGIININGIDGFDYINIYDLTGRIIFKREISLNSDKIDIDLSDNDKGIYIININSDNKSLYYKCIIK